MIFESKALLKAWSSEVDDEKNSRLSQLFPPNAKVFVADLKSLIIGLKGKQNPQGKAHRYLDNICNTLDSHSAMISMLPDQSIYASIFCGVFKTLVSVRKFQENLTRTLLTVEGFYKPPQHHRSAFPWAEGCRGYCSLLCSKSDLG